MKGVQQSANCKVECTAECEAKCTAECKVQCTAECTLYLSNDKIGSEINVDRLEESDNDNSSLHRP